MKYLDLILGFVFFVLGALAVSRAGKAADPKIARREWFGAAACTLAGLIFTSLYMFAPSGAPAERPAAAAEERR